MARGRRLQGKSWRLRLRTRWAGILPAMREMRIDSRAWERLHWPSPRQQLPVEIYMDGFKHLGCMWVYKTGKYIHVIYPKSCSNDGSYATGTVEFPDNGTISEVFLDHFAAVSREFSSILWMHIDNGTILLASTSIPIPDCRVEYIHGISIFHKLAAVVVSVAQPNGTHVFTLHVIRVDTGVITKTMPLHGQGLTYPIVSLLVTKETRL
jgi:hypothetical protein